MIDSGSVVGAPQRPEFPEARQSVPGWVPSHHQQACSKVHGSCTHRSFLLKEKQMCFPEAVWRLTLAGRVLVFALPSPFPPLPPLPPFASTFFAVGGGPGGAALPAPAFVIANCFLASFCFWFLNWFRDFFAAPSAPPAGGSGRLVPVGGSTTCRGRFP